MTPEEAAATRLFARDWNRTAPDQRGREYYASYRKDGGSLVANQADLHPGSDHGEGLPDRDQ